MDRRALTSALLWSSFMAALVIFAMVICWQISGPWPYVVAVFFAGSAFRSSLRRRPRPGASADPRA